MTKFWVKFQNNNATRVSTKKDDIVDDLIQTCKIELPNLLGSYDSAQLSLSITIGGQPLRPGLSLAELPSQPGYSGNDDEHPLFINVVVGSLTTVHNIIDNAFPSLGKRQLNSKTKSTTRFKSNYGIVADVVDGTLGILQEFKLPTLSKTTSFLWTEADGTIGKTLQNWSGEIDIQTYVKYALIDCFKLTSELKTLNIHREQTFSFASLMERGNRADVTVFVNETSSITSVVEVKVPGSKMTDIYQIVDYMCDLRNAFNVRFVFGVFTTYKEWRFLWFEDTDAAASCISKHEFDELCLAGSANEYSISAGKVKIFQSKIYQFSDPALIECLVTLLYKVSMTPVYNPTKFIDYRARYIYATPSNIQYKTLPKTLKGFKFAMPHSRTTNFYILSYFHRGGDGRVALVTSEKGNLAVIKFLHDTGDSASLQQRLSAEKNHWLNLWDVNCRTVVLDGRSGLLMPFCLPFGGKKFSTLQTWDKVIKFNNKEDLGMLSEGLEISVNTELLQKFQDSPLLAAKQALDVVSTKLSSHKDLFFRHVALLPILNSVTKQYDFRGILIDLTRFETGLDANDAKQCAEEGLKLLEMELEQCLKEDEI